MTKRGRKSVEAPASGLIDAVRFVAVAAKDVGPPIETHIRLSDQWATMFDGVLATGHKINDALLACPHALKFLAALERCSDNLSLVQLNGALSIKSNKFRALIPCVDPALLELPKPDEPVATINDAIKEGLQVIGSVVDENAQRVMFASALLKSGSMIATDGALLLEYWHGIDLPPGLALPKIAIQALSRKAKSLSRFGFSPNNSATFHFDDDSFIRTQLFAETWPLDSVNRILDERSNPWPIPTDFYTAVDALTPFSVDGMLRCREGVLQTHDDAKAGASYEVYGLPAGPALLIKRLKIIRPFVKTIDFNGPGGVVYFFDGGKIRGAMAGMRNA